MPPALQLSAIVETNGTFSPLNLQADAQSDRSLSLSLHREGKKWMKGRLPANVLRKKHGLQGPIDDAFMDSFVIVRPTGKSVNEKFANWSEQESKHAIEHWRRHFRGEAREGRRQDQRQ